MEINDYLGTDAFSETVRAKGYPTTTYAPRLSDLFSSVALPINCTSSKYWVYSLALRRYTIPT